MLQVVVAANEAAKTKADPRRDMENSSSDILVGVGVGRCPPRGGCRKRSRVVDQRTPAHGAVQKRRSSSHKIFSNCRGKLLWSSSWSRERVRGCEEMRQIDAGRRELAAISTQQTYV